jgi:TetR/AcrR family transcriptional regulator
MTEKKARTRSRPRRLSEASILAAAERVFAESGFAGASMARIAEAAGLPKANIHYYFGTKEALYREVLTNILRLWLDAADAFTRENAPAEAIETYVRAKMAWSRDRPHASRVFANEVLHGAPFLRTYLETDLKSRVEQKTRIVEGWMAAGLMRRLDPRHLFFMIWATTQTYADFAVQIEAVMGARALDGNGFERATDEVVGLVLSGCGLAPAAAGAWFCPAVENSD